MKLRYRRISYGGTESAGRQMEHLLDHLWDISRNSALGAFGEWRPPIDVYQTADEVSIQIEIAGMREDDFDVTLFNDMLVIKGERRPITHPDQEMIYHEAGVRYGRFRAEVYLPVTVDVDKTSAQYENGFLIIKVPKHTMRLHPVGEQSEEYNDE